MSGHGRHGRKPEGSGRKGLGTVLAVTVYAAVLVTAGSADHRTKRDGLERAAYEKSVKLRCEKWARSPMTEEQRIMCKRYLP